MQQKMLYPFIRDAHETDLNGSFQEDNIVLINCMSQETKEDSNVDPVF